MDIWTPQLRPGDKVILVHQGFSRNASVVRIIKVTPKGYVTVEGWTGTFDARGNLRGKRDSYKSTFIEPWTSEAEDEIKRTNLVRHLASGKHDWDKCTLEELRHVKAILTRARGRE